MDPRSALTPTLGPASTFVDRALGYVLIALGVGLTGNSLLGPVGVEAIDYAIPEDGVLMAQTIGLDVFSLAIVAPLCIAVGVLAMRDGPAAPLLAFAPSLYAAYLMPQYILGPEHLDLPGNSQAFFPLHLALFVLGGAAATLAWRELAASRLSPPGAMERRIGGVLLPVLALLVFSRYLPGIIDAASENPSAVDYREGPTFYWTIALLDLGVALPMTVAGAIALRRGAPWGRRAVWAVAGWFALVGPAVGAMAIAMEIRGTPDASAGRAVVMTILGLAFVVIAAALYREGLRFKPSEADVA